MGGKKSMSYVLIRNSSQTFYKFAVSKKYQLDILKKEVLNREEGSILPYNLDSKILIYEDRQKTWFFDIAERLKQDNEAGFVILMIAVAYLEGNQQYRNGSTSENNSTRALRMAMDRIFPHSFEDVKKLFIKQVRQGFFHDGITRKSVFISGEFAYPLEKQKDRLLINPHKFLDSVKNDFESYIDDLKKPENQELRTNFESFWDFFKGI